MSEHQDQARWSVAEWHDKMLVDRDGEKIGKLQGFYVDVETDEPQFATVKEGFICRHLTFVPLGGIQVGRDDLQVAVTKEQVRSAPDIEMHDEELSQADESTLYHHFELNYTPPRPPLSMATANPRHVGTASERYPTGSAVPNGANGLEPGRPFDPAWGRSAEEADHDE